MSRSAKVYIKGIYAGLLTEIDREYTSSYLFPVFFNMTSEGDNRIIQARNLHIDEEDDFGILLATAHTDTIGAITIKKM